MHEHQLREIALRFASNLAYANKDIGSIVELAEKFYQFMITTNPAVRTPIISNDNL